MTYPPDTPSSTYRPDAPSTYPAADTPSAYPAADTSPALPAEDSPSAYPDPAAAYSSPTTQTPPSAEPTDTSDSSTTEVAQQQASEMSDTAAQAGAQVAGVAKEQAANVAAESQAQAKHLLGKSRDELQSQAGQQQQRIAGGLRSLGTELQQMASSSDQDGPATQMARQVADRIGTAASWLEDREPGQVLTEVQRFARQRPGAFLAVAATAGLLAGRLTRGLTADGQSTEASTSSTYAGLSPTGSSSQGQVQDQPGDGWPTTGAEADPGSYGTGPNPAQSFQAPAPPPTAWGQDPAQPEGEGAYYGSGIGTDSGAGRDTGTGRVGQ